VISDQNVRGYGTRAEAGTKEVARKSQATKKSYHTKKAELFNRVKRLSSRAVDSTIRHTTCLGGYQAFFIPRQRNVPSSSKKMRYLAI
jgi:hypothetical protein